MASIDYRGPFSKANAFTNKATHPLLLDLVMIKEFGPTYLGWEPETCWTEISKSFGVVISEVNRAKLQAVRTCHVVDTPYETWPAFEKIAVSFGGGIPKFDIMQVSTPHRFAATLESMKSVRDQKVSSEVYRYIAGVLLDTGHCYAPGILEPCNEFLLAYVDKPLQAKVKKAVEKGIEPTFDGNRPEDAQIAKSRSISDFVEFENRILLKQLNVVFKGSK